MTTSLRLVLSLLWVTTAMAYAGPQPTGKDIKEVAAEATPCPEWYSDTEWNISVWGTYAWAGTNGTEDIGNSFTFNQRFTTINLSQFLSSDRYLETDHAWGGGVDVKYFFHRYFGIGVEGFLLDAQRNTLDIEVPQPLVMSVSRDEDSRVIGSALGTFTFRYPIRCSRISPYVWAGGGAIFNGGEEDVLFVDNVCGGGPCNQPSATTIHRGSQTEPVGQFGGGLEFRFNRHIGWMNDFSWNVVDGPNNNFGMVRSGLTFSF
ncbi:MAG TPA: hypothetical protein VJ719_07590 [Chthoniobacterales bacterium]|nr:hypothetical protein [Chthoniobacterales bacterium]